MSHLSNTQLAMLAYMDIPFYRLKAPKLPVNIIKDSTHANVLLMVGREGSWEKYTFDQQNAYLNMMERLIKALKRDFKACVVAEFHSELFPDELIECAQKTGIEKIIVFGKNLGYFLGMESTFRSKINALYTAKEEIISVAVIPSLELLQSDPLQKKEAWGCLAPIWIKD